MASDATLVDDKHLDPDDTQEITPCVTAEDFFNPAARDGIGRHCERFLNENALTPTELLHSPRHQNTLSNQAIFVGILQQAERVMGRKSGSLNALVNDVAMLTRQRSKEWVIPELTAENYTASVKEVMEKDAQTGRWIVDAALTQFIHAGRSFAEKTGQLLTLADTVGEGGDEEEREAAMGPLDRLLGEMVRSESGMASISGDMPFVRLVDTIIILATGDTPLPDDTPALVTRLGALMRRVNMPLLSDSLMVAFRRELAKPHRFAVSSIGDMFGIESVQKEVLALARIAQRVKTGDGYRGGARTEGSLQRRMALLLNEDTLPEIIKGRNFIEKIRILFMLQKMPLTPISLRAVNQYLKVYFDGREFAGRLLDCWKEQSDKLKGLAEVQRLMLDSAFPAEERDTLAKQIDEVQYTFIRTQRILSPLQQIKTEPTADKVLEIVKLAGEKAFCEGKSRITAARALYRQVHRPRFIRAFLLGAQGTKERAARAAWMRGALATIGVPFIDMSNLRVMVVDDEDGPRNYVESVLHDLGVGVIETMEDGQQALDRFLGHEDRYDLIICDWMMPRASGLEVLKQVRAVRPDLPFLMVTALATRKAVEHALAHQVTAYIVKPFTPDQLEDKVFIVLTQKGAPGSG
ncbi:CheY-like chemotaxis protein [Azospirillum fermentarium]|uniref:response regulator n=1 Tax=Azospirillum fermentarium TaxID=1233114 RepID=UPI002227BD02|nr:response regulator [Azospirillum fermentarium]MCW2246334.1 CheY-like chemotaxis protein [Azospirillum fermentarium]